MKTYPVHMPCRESESGCCHGLLLVLVLGMAMFAGCGKNESPKPVATNTSNTSNAAPTMTPGSPPVPPQGGASAVPTADTDATVVQQLNRAVLGYRMQYNRFPGSVEEIASYAHIQLPSPPPGKKYAFNARGLVVLVDKPTK